MQYPRFAARRHFVPSLLVASALAACGGGGGSGSNTAALSAPDTSALGAAAASAAMLAQQQVNTSTTGEQDNASIARLADGGYVVAWTSTAGPVNAPATTGVCWRRFTRAAAPVAGETCIASPTAARLQTGVAPLANGGFTIAWQVLPATYYADVNAQTYDASGQAVGGVRRVNTTANDESYVDAAGVAGGSVITWRDNLGNGILTQRLDANGLPVGGEQRANTFAGPWNGGGANDGHVAALEGGGYVVVWVSQFQAGAPSTAVYAQRFDAAGNRVGGETLVSNNAIQSLYPKVAGLAGGGYVIAWNEASAAVAQRFAGDGSRVGAQQQLDADWLAGPADTCYRPYATPCPRYQVIAAVTGLDDGSYVAAFSNNRGISQAMGLQARQYGTDGAAMGPSTSLLAPPPYGTVRLARADGGFIAAWSHEDGDGFGIFAQRFDAGTLR